MSPSRSRFIVSLLSTTFSLVGCGKYDNKNSTLTGSPKLAFYAADFGKGSAIYALDLKTFKIAPTISHSKYVDAKVFLDSKTGEFFVATRNPLEEGASTLTRLGSSSLRVIEELGALPVNLFGLLRLPGDRLLATGWNSGQIAILPPSLSKVEIATSVPSGLPSGIENRRFVGALGNASATFAISGGTDENFQPQQVQAHKLSSDFTKVESSSSVSDCRNIAGDGNEGILLLKTDQAVISCNPRYNQSRGTWSGLMALVLLEASGDAITTRTLATASVDASFDMYLIRAGSNDGAAILVEEALSTATDPYLSVQSRYWLNVASGAKTPVTNYGGQGIFQKSIDAYLFACAPDTKGGCKEEKFCLVKRNANLEDQTCAEKTVRFDYAFRSFPQPIPVAQ